MAMNPLLTTLPILNESRTKDQIVTLLSYEWPLTLRKIHFKLKDGYGRNESYQAVYKAVKELTDEKILIRNGMEYCLNLDWLRNVKKMLSTIERNYTGGSKDPIIEGVINSKIQSNVTQLTFKTLVDMDKFWLRTKEAFYESLHKENEVTCWIGNHCWWLLVYPELEHHEIAMLKKKKVQHYMVCTNNTELDQWCSKFYQQLKVNFLIKETDVESDMAVFGDNIMQVYIPKEIKEKINLIFKNNKDSSDIDIAAFIRDILNEKVEINLTLTKNKDFATAIKKQVMGFFREQKN